MPFTVIDELAVDSRVARVYEHGWQSWSPTTSYPVTGTSHRPVSAASQAMRYRSGRPATGIEICNENGDRMLPSSGLVTRAVFPADLDGVRVDVRRRLRERPHVTADVLGAVLPFAVRMIDRRLKDLRAVPPSAFVVRVRVRDAHEHGAGASGTASHDDGAIAEDELGAVVTDTKSLSESERPAEPVARLDHIVVRQLGNDGGRGHRTIRDHADLLARTTIFGTAKVVSVM